MYKFDSIKIKKIVTSLDDLYFLEDCKNLIESNKIYYQFEVGNLHVNYK